MSQTVLFGLTLAVGVSAWQCPAGFAGPAECQQENFGSCFDNTVVLGTGDMCTGEGATLSTFDHRQYGSGNVYRGCGVDTGSDADCCNCWRLRAGSAAMLGSSAEAADNNSAGAPITAAADNSSGVASKNTSANLRGAAFAECAPSQQVPAASTEGEKAALAGAEEASANSTGDDASMNASSNLRGAALAGNAASPQLRASSSQAAKSSAECVAAGAACGWNGQQNQRCCGGATCKHMLGNVGGKMVCVGGEGQCVARGQVCGGPGQRDRPCCAGSCEGGPYEKKICEDKCVGIWQVCGGPGQRDQRCCHGHCAGGPYEEKKCKLF